jgi:tetratricopeptide (TPR) repeat protein
MVTSRLDRLGRIASLGIALALPTAPAHGQDGPGGFGMGDIPTTQSASESARLADSLRRQIDAAVAINDGPTLRRAREAAERAAGAQPSDPWLVYYRGYAVFREAGFLLGASRIKELGGGLDAAVAALERSLGRSPSPDGWALLSALQGQRLTASGSTFTAIRLGPAVLRAIGRAEESGPQNPRVWLLKGINAFNAPGAFGGGMDKAEGHLRRALALFAADRPTAPLPTWGLADAWIWLGRALQAQGKRAEARAAYATAVQLQPQNTWLTDVLIPSLEQGRNG